MPILPTPRPAGRYFFLRILGAVCLLFLIMTAAGCHQPSLEKDPSPPSQTATQAPAESLTLPQTEPSLPAISHPELPADSTIPVLHVITEDRAPVLSRAYYVGAELTVLGADQPEGGMTVACEIRGRGHSSFDPTADQDDYLSKNSYRIKLSRKLNLLDTGKGADRDWLLISCKFDASALRSFLIWDLAGRMGTIPYVPGSAWVELYVNGDYRGLYVLCEAVEVSADRVDVDDSPSADPLQAGYLLEYDLRGNTAENAAEGLTYFYLPGSDRQVEWVVKSAVCTAEETAAIRSHLLSCHEAILSGDRGRIEALVDLSSLVDTFILQELSKNPDVSCSSFFVQRNPGGKLYLTAPWDFDLAFGTYSASVSTVKLVANGKDLSSHPWFEALVTRAWFIEAVQARMAEVKPLLDETLAAIDSLRPVLTPAADRNHARWSIYGRKYTYCVNEQASMRLESYDDHVDFLLSWTERRWPRMEQALRYALDSAE